MAGGSAISPVLCGAGSEICASMCGCSVHHASPRRDLAMWSVRADATRVNSPRNRRRGTGVGPGGVAALVAVPRGELGRCWARVAPPFGRLRDTGHTLFDRISNASPCLDRGLRRDSAIRTTTKRARTSAHDQAVRVGVARPASTRKVRPGRTGRRRHDGSRLHHRAYRVRARRVRRARMPSPSDRRSGSPPCCPTDRTP